MFHLIWLAIRKVFHNYNLWIVGSLFATVLILCALLGFGMGGFFWATYVGWKWGVGIGILIDLFGIYILVDHELNGRRSAEGMTMMDAYKERG